MSNNNLLSIEEVRKYWGEKNIPQQWYSKKEPFTLPWFNELSYKRFERYYRFKKYNWAEFEYHKGEEVLEIGCGIGTDSVEYAKNGANVTATDLGADQVRLTKLNFELRGLPYRQIVQADAENLPFPDNTFDLVYCDGVIHHTPNTEKAVSEIYRVLKPDGQALVLIYARGWKHYIKRCLIHGILKGRWLANNFDWRKVYNEASEVNGFTPKAAVYTKRQVKNLFKMFKQVETQKRRMGEFFEYKPYNTVKFPSFVNKLCELFNLEGLLGENWTIRAQKREYSKEASLWAVLFKHY